MNVNYSVEKIMLPPRPVEMGGDQYLVVLSDSLMPVVFRFNL